MNDKLKILIVGGSGMIGYKLANFLLKQGYEICSTYNKNMINDLNSIFLDVVDSTSIEVVFKKFNPDIVIHCAALANVDLCETEHELADKINIQGTLNVVNACKKNNSKLIFVSTSYVFDGKKNIYYEDDETLSITYYGYTKMMGEKLVKNSHLDYLILRTDQPYGWTETWQRSNSVLNVINDLKLDKDKNEIIDWFNTPTYLDDFVLTTSLLIQKQSTGIFHLVGPDFINRVEWAKIIAEVFNLNKNKIHSIDSSSLNLPAKRGNIRISNKKLEKETGIIMKGVKLGAEDMLKNYKSIS